MIIVVGEWDDAVQPVVAAGQLKNNENGAIFPRDGLRDRVGGQGVERKKCFLNENRQRPCGGSAERGSAQKFTAGLKCRGRFHNKHSSSRATSRDPGEVNLKLTRRDPSQPSHKATARQATALGMTETAAR